ncbi:MAG TPA: ATP-binding protein [Dehalococcoidia bacterium]|nr:ATP-binding protein [Dehalococcoidia bacterium]
MAEAKDLAGVYEAALTCIQRSLGVERAAVLRFDDEGVMRFCAWRGLSEGYRAAVEGHSPWTPETTDAAPVLVEDVTADASLGNLRDTLEAEGIAALAFVPLRLGTKLLGKFMLYYGRPHQFEASEVLTAQTIAAHVAFAIDQRAHRESEQRYRHVLENMGVAVYATDAQGRITFFNEEAAALWGRRPELGVERWCGSMRVYWPDGAPMALDVSPVAQALQSGKAVRGHEAIAERPDGTRVNFVPYPTPVFDTDGNLTGVVNVLVDITARKRAESALQEQEASLVAALEEKQRVLAEREETIRLYEEVQAQLASLIEASRALISPLTRDDTVNSILQIAEKLLRADAFAVWRFASERDQWELTSSRGLSDEYVRGSVIKEFDGQRQLAQELVVEDVHAAPELSRLVERYDREGIRAMLVMPLGVGTDHHGTIAFYYRQPHTFSGLEVRVGVALANLASASLTAARLFAENERSRAALLRANADLERTAADLRLANAAKDEFLSLVSHELKTPLTTIRGNAGVLLRSWASLDDETRGGALADIVAESERLHRIIENLLLLARAEQGQQVPPEPLLVKHVLRRVVDRFRQYYPHRTFEVLEYGDPRPVMFSNDFLEQVMDNLLSNAEKYSPPSEPIVIAVERDEREVRMMVLDRGIGIAAEDAERIFDPFYRSGAARGRAEGLGIGLAVCKRLVEAQGGRMWARPREGGGSEFGVALLASDE